MEKPAELITFRTFDTSINAHLVKSRLENEEIECYIFDENINSLNLLYSVAVGGKLKIKNTDLDRAEVLMKDVESLELKDDENNIVECPKCHSTEFYSGYRSMKGIKGIISAVISFAFLAFPIYYKTVYKCTKCGFEFKDRNKIAEV